MSMFAAFMGGVLAPTYRYLRINFAVGAYDTVAFTEIAWVAGGADYPSVAMTSGSSPSPLVVTASNYDLGPSYLVFDRSNSTTVFANTNTHGIGPTFTIDLGAGNAIAPTGIGITTSVGASFGNAFTCYGSNNATFTTGQVLLLSQGTTYGTWTNNVRKNFTF